MNETAEPTAEDYLRAAAYRLIAFLEECNDADIRAGMGAILGLGSEDEQVAFERSIAEAIKLGMTENR